MADYAVVYSPLARQDLEEIQVSCYEVLYLALLNLKVVLRHMENVNYPYN